MKLHQYSDFLTLTSEFCAQDVLLCLFTRAIQRTSLVSYHQCPIPASLAHALSNVVQNSCCGNNETHDAEHTLDDTIMTTISFLL